MSVITYLTYRIGKGGGMCRLGSAATGRVVTRPEGDFVFWVEGGCMKDEGNGAVEDDGELEVSFLFCIFWGRGK
jgi:hypothetical protein